MVHIDDLPTDSRKRIQSIVKDLGMVVSERKDLEEAEKALKEQLIEEMLPYRLDYVENDCVEVRYMEPTTTFKINSKKLEIDHPEIYAEYLQVSEKKGFLKVNGKKSKETESESGDEE
ncbi:MAG: hypothetical protein LBU81_03150 [Methanosarcinales archaeon]|jgi:myo-inositol-1-phosphate synthase|nr:hypothetical protein [Methanosarcinales archaeon]